MSKPVEIEEAKFDEAVLKEKMPVLVDFWAPWCGPGRGLRWKQILSLSTNWLHTSSIPKSLNAIYTRAIILEWG